MRPDMPRCTISVSPRSRSASRYFERRRSAVTRAPVSRSAKPCGQRPAQVGPPRLGARDHPARQHRLEPAAHRLDLGQFGHRRLHPDASSASEPTLYGRRSPSLKHPEPMAALRQEGPSETEVASDTKGGERPVGARGICEINAAEQADLRKSEKVASAHQSATAKEALLGTFVASSAPRFENPAPHLLSQRPTASGASNKRRFPEKAINGPAPNMATARISTLSAGTRANTRICRPA